MFHLALNLRGGYKGRLIAVPPSTDQLVRRQSACCRRAADAIGAQIDPKRVATSKRKPKQAQPKGYVNGKTARAHVSTARVLAQARP